MNILHYVESTDSRHGGVPRFVLDATRVMARQGHECTVLTLDTKDTPAAFLDENAANGRGGHGQPRVCRLPRPGLFGKLFGPHAIRIVREHLKTADVLHLHCIWSPTAFQIAATARQMGIPYVLTLHGMLDDWSMTQRSMKKRAYMALGGRSFLERAAQIHCTAQAELDQSKKWFPLGTAAVIPYLIDLEPYRQLPPSPRRIACKTSTTPTILFLSRLHEKKGLEHLLHAAANLKARAIAAKFIIAGTGEPEYIASLKALSKQLGIEDRVEFVGQVTGGDKTRLYQNADMFVLPTSQENCGLVLIEALACGTPVITTNGVDIWRDVEQSGAAMIVDQSAAAIADALANVLMNADALRTMSANARPWVFETFGEVRLIACYEAMYAKCATRPAMKPRPMAPAVDASIHVPAIC